jgi:hypothetical protein
MLRKTLIALAATAAVGLAAGTADAKGGPGHSGSFGSVSSGSFGNSGRSMNMSPGHPMNVSSGRPMNMAPVNPRGPGNWQTGQNWSGSTWGHHHHHRHDRFFFGAGFAGPYFDYGYDSCWAWTPWGWRYVCGYPYWGY